jgi:hypothetical protein
MSQLLLVYGADTLSRRLPITACLPDGSRGRGAVALYDPSSPQSYFAQPAGGQLIFWDFRGCGILLLTAYEVRAAGMDAWCLDCSMSEDTGPWIEVDDQTAQVRRFAKHESLRFVVSARAPIPCRFLRLRVRAGGPCLQLQTFEFIGRVAPADGQD